MNFLQKTLSSSGLGARLMRSSVWIAMSFGLSQVIRLGSNLVLTRLLFPEAFGLMALITAFLVGLALFSDVGVGASIQQNPRGDEPEFLDTAWTIQVLRGGMLWIACWLFAWPVGQFYGDPLLTQMLPVCGISLLIAGFNPTRIETANRHLLVGRLVALDLISQVLGILAMLAAAWYLRSVWALVMGNLVPTAAKLVLTHYYLPGHRNRFRLDPTSRQEIIHFGKWIFLSTVCGFLMTQGDKIILGKYLTFESLGIYNIGFFLATFPQSLAFAIMGRILIPLYRESPPHASRENFLKVRRVRFTLSGVVFGMQFVLAFIGVPLIELMYDDRFAAAGAVVVGVSLASMPQLVGMLYDGAALAAGDSRNTFFQLLIKAITQTTFLLVGAHFFGLVGVIAGVGVAQLLTHPVVIWLARRHGAWDAFHDAVVAAIALALGSLAFWVNRDALAMLIDALGTAP